MEVNIKIAKYEMVRQKFKIIYLLNIHADQLDTDTHMCMHTIITHLAKKMNKNISNNHMDLLL